MLIGHLCTFKGKAVSRNQILVFNHFIRNGENYFYHKLRQLRFHSTVKNFSKLYYDCKKSNIKEKTKLIVIPKNIGIIFSLIHLINQCNKGTNEYVMNISRKIILFDHIKKMIMLRMPVFLKLILIKALVRIYIENVEEVEDFVYEEYLEIFINLVDNMEN